MHVRAFVERITHRAFLQWHMSILLCFAPVRQQQTGMLVSNVTASVVRVRVQRDAIVTPSYSGVEFYMAYNSTYQGVAKIRISWLKLHTMFATKLNCH